MGEITTDRPTVKSRWDRERVYANVMVEDEEGEMVKDPGHTQQHHAASVDIRNILMAAKKGIPIESVAWGTPQFGDFSNVDSYVVARQRIASTNEDFGRLPSEIRNRFQNDPAKLVEFLSNPANLNEAVELGIITPGQPDQVVAAVPKPPPNGEGEGSGGETTTE